ncbi:hypothetical protein ACFX1X_000213 [Malus domestica]
MMWDLTIHRFKGPDVLVGTLPSSTTSQARLSRSTILSALGLDHTLTVLFLGTHTRTSQWVTHPGIALRQTRLTSEFRWNPKPVSSQKASCYMEVSIYI